MHKANMSTFYNASCLCLLYARCLQVLKEEFQRDMSKKYGFAALKYVAVET